VETTTARDLHGFDAHSREAFFQPPKSVADQHGTTHARAREALEVRTGEAPGSPGGERRLASGRDRSQGVDDALGKYDLVSGRALVEDPADHAGGEQQHRVVVVCDAPGAQSDDLATGRAHRHHDRSDEMLVTRAPVDAERNQALPEASSRFRLALWEAQPERTVREPEREALCHRDADPEA
jgi:hypothetical protein